MTTTARTRIRTTIVDHHATWIAVNPVQGCPKRCRYCFLNDRGQAGVAPEILAGPEQAVDLLLDSPYYAAARPVAFYTWTDVMAVRSSREHLTATLSVLVERKITNPIVLITKCHVPDEVIADIVDARERGVPVLVYLSLSGLDDSVERGVRHAALWENFPRLSAFGIPVIHYWRPGTPASASEDVMSRVLDHAAAYARCTMAAGLKVELAALKRLSGIWPELAVTDGVTSAECVYPRAFWEFIHRTWQRHPGYPMFHTNSCALAYVLNRPDTFGIFGSTVCRLRNHCPLPQRNRCQDADAVRSRPDADLVRQVLARYGLEAAEFTVSPDGRDITVYTEVGTATAAALTHDLRTRVHVDRDGTDGYWNSGTAGALPLIIG